MRIKATAIPPLNSGSEALVSKRLRRQGTVPACRGLQGNLSEEVLHSVGGVKGFKERALLLCCLQNNTAQPDYLELRCKGSNKIDFLLEKNLQ